MVEDPVGPRHVLAASLRFAVYVAGLVGMGNLLVYHPVAADPWGVFGEGGHAETMQLVVLLLGIAVGGTAAWRYPAGRPATSLLVLFLVAALVREHNNLLKDHVARYAWHALVAAIAFVALFVAWRGRRNLAPSVHGLLSSPGTGWMAAGLALLAFGQPFDDRALWSFVLGTHEYPYAMQRVVEEALELAGYWFFSAGLLEHAVVLRRRHLGRAATAAPNP